MINTYGKQILRYCHLMLRDYHEAQDAVQTTFLRAYYGRDGKASPISNSNSPTDAAKSEFSSLLYRIAYNCCVDILRKRKRWLSFLEKTPKPENVYHDEPSQTEDGMSEEIRGALGTLSAEDRAIIISRLVDDLDYNQISIIYKINAAALRKRYARAKEKLAKALRERGLEGAYGK